MFYVSLAVITKEKPAVKTQKIRRKESKHNTIKKSSTHKDNQRKKGTTKQSEKSFLHGGGLSPPISNYF